jgi:hypothetical protein
MPGTRSLLIFALLWTTSLASAQDLRDDIRILFTGDILLSRNVSAEIAATDRNPWLDFQSLFRSADWVAGNLEGVVGSKDFCCSSTASSPCFAVHPGHMRLLAQAGFNALAHENNHAYDLGETGRSATEEALAKEGIQTMTFQGSPYFFEIRGMVVGVVAFSLVPDRSGRRLQVPSLDLLQKLRLVRTLAHVVIASVHWGSELLDWPDNSQRRVAAFVDLGADIIFGHHPHVVQAAECLKGRPVFFSLGNHLFDQKYPATKEGHIADCRTSQGTIQCGAIRTETPPGTSFPELGQGNPIRLSDKEACSVPLREPLSLSGFRITVKDEPSAPGSGSSRKRLQGVQDGKTRWQSGAIPLLSVEKLELKKPGEKLLLTLESHYSTIDGEVGFRPHVYEATEQGLIARWHGSALAWPLLDAFVLPGEDGLICALHRGDSFLTLNTDTESRRVAVYRWNGFGFSGVADQDVLKECGLFYERAGLIEKRTMD